jgi:membrane fusion protein (multidrug efflux system)
VSAAQSATARRRMPGRALWLGIALAALALGGGMYAAELLSRSVATDDAFVEARMVYVSPQVSGRVVEVLVDEHERVEAEQVLVRLDAREYEVAVERARAALAAARNDMARAEAAAASDDAEQKAAGVEVWRTDRELERLRSLLERDAASQSDLDAVQAAHDAARARVRALGLRAEAERALLVDEAPVRQAEAELRDARLRLSRTEVRAPFGGFVGRTNVEPGAVVSPGQALLALVDDRSFWVMANFKETQVRRLRPGAAARVEVDALPDLAFRGHVDSFSPATGAKYALIAPEPAAGNFTKVVQRVPVKIELDGVEGGGPLPEDLAERLAAGLSAEVRVDVE